MSRLVILCCLIPLLINCASTNLSVEQKLEKSTEQVRLSYIIGANGKLSNGKALKPGKQQLYVRVIETLPTDKQYVIESYHTLNTDLKLDNTYRLATEVKANLLHVWIEDQQQNAVSNVSSIKLSDFEYVPLKKVVESNIERIEIVAKRPNKFELSRKDDNKCKVKSRTNKMRAGPSESITANKLPSRFYRGC